MHFMLKMCIMVEHVIVATEMTSLEKVVVATEVTLEALLSSESQLTFGTSRAFLFVEILLKIRLNLNRCVYKYGSLLYVDIFLDMQSLTVVSFNSTASLVDLNKNINGESESSTNF
ncbi:hypothetical protein V6N11_060421 [Hibiscus sabdariffa]|uniref:Uncharacterized protein n=1 Tax=Hibiscus sabdariffa TaxID=183260 RepID=A0ABR2QQ96_9ROSI